MRPSVKIGLGILGGLAAGSALGYYIATTHRGRSAIKAVEDAVSGVRRPEPGYAMEIPETEEQFNLLDELVCECGAPVVDAAKDEDTVFSVVSKIQSCMARELYPDFPWPPIPGDHPTVSQLYAELSVIARRSLAIAEICPRPIPPIPDLPYPTPLNRRS